MKIFYFTALICLSLTASAKVKQADVDAFIKSTASEYHLDADWIADTLRQAKHQQSIIDAMNKPAEKVLEWYQYRPIFMTEKRTNDGVTFWQEHAEILRKVSQESNVPPELIVAIIGVETSYGRIMGSHKVLDALYTLAFDYPKRSAFFSKELAHFLKLADDGHVPALTAKGSYAGAMGYGQFMPSSYRSYAADYEKDGVIDLLGNPQDAIASVANYINKHGWEKGQKVVESAQKPTTKIKLNQLKPHLEDKHGQPYTLIGMQTEKGTLAYWHGFHNFYVISRYNHSHMYVMAVYQLSQALKQKHAEAQQQALKEAEQ